MAVLKLLTVAVFDGEREGIPQPRTSNRKGTLPIHFPYTSVFELEILGGSKVYLQSIKFQQLKKINRPLLTQTLIHKK